MQRFLLAMALIGAAFSPVSAQSLVRLGEDAQVSAGERVDDVITMGGDAVIRGHVTGDVVTMGGDARIEGEVDGDVMTMGGDIEVFGHVHGSVATSGGDLEMHPGGQVDGPRSEHGAQSFELHHRDDGIVSRAESFTEGAFSFFARFGLLLLLALGLHTLARSRYEAMQVAMVKEPIRAGLMGGVLFLGAIAAIVVLAITVIGIPAAFVTGLSLAVVSYIGMAVAAAVVGALLPAESLRGKDALRIAAGVGTLLLISLVPVAGTVLSLVLTAAGIGALALTRLGGRPLPAVPSEGPYR